MSYSFPNCFDNFTPLQFGSMISNISGVGISPVTFSITGNSQLCINQTATYTVNTLPGEFVDKILKGDQDIAVGKGVKMTVKEFKALCK